MGGPKHGPGYASPAKKPTVNENAWREISQPNWDHFEDVQNRWLWHLSDNLSSEDFVIAKKTFFSFPPPHP